ncbi:MAG: hypothetical protein E6I65_05960 [Chloroflexi bacterium]|nr:MAG: hypothetical protein E6I65_05960 [Chloroflexota bacterium]
MARAKQTDRAEARRRYRQTTAQTPGDDDTELDFGERRPDATSAKPAQAKRNEPQQTGRPGFMGAFRQSYRPPHVREDLLALPSLVRTRGFLAAIALVIVGAGVVLVFPNYTGSRFAWELLVWPGSALAPQLLAGFFAPRASYLLGLLVGIVQGIVFTIFLTQFADRLGTTLPPDQMTSLLSVSFLTGPISGALFAAAAAWYRRFLALSSPARAGAGKGGARRSSSR